MEPPRYSNSPSRFAKLRSRDLVSDAEPTQREAPPILPGPAPLQAPLPVNFPFPAKESPRDSAPSSSRSSRSASMAGFDDSQRNSTSSIDGKTSLSDQQAAWMGSVMGRGTHESGVWGVGLFFRPDANGQYFVEGVIPGASAHRRGLSCFPVQVA